MSKGYSLKDFTSWKTGGTCALLIAPHTVSEAVDFLHCCREHQKQFYILGGGTNLLVADGYTDKAVIYTGHIKQMCPRHTDDGCEIEVDCGCTTKMLLAYAFQHCLGGVEFLTGIPGTIGGALFGNAGGRSDYGFNAIVAEITTINNKFGLQVYKKEDMRWQYRSCPVNKSDLMIVSCRLTLRHSDKSMIVSNIRKFANLKKGQPIGKATAGCVFKNPAEINLSAGKLIDNCGCRGMRFGGAMVSQSHANFIENIGNATSNDIYTLCEKCRAKVFEKYGVMLEYEIKFFGNVTKNGTTN